MEHYNVQLGKTNMQACAQGQGSGLDGGLGKEGINIWEYLTYKPSLPVYSRANLIHLQGNLSMFLQFLSFEAYLACARKRTFILSDLGCLSFRCSRIFHYYSSPACPTCLSTGPVCVHREADGRGGRTLFIPREGAARCGGPAVSDIPPHALDRQLEISRLLPATNGEIFFTSFPLFCLLRFRGRRKETFLGFKINKSSQQTGRGECEGSSSRAFEPKN